jgi:hypothetical protein
MLERITKYAGILPLMAIAVYVFGYISLNSYLTSFGINENIGLDFKILKVGILFAIIIGPIILLCFSDFKLGDYSNSDVSEQVINTLHDGLGYTILYAIAICNVLAKPIFDRLTIIMVIFLIVTTILNKVKLKRNYLKILKSIFIVVPFFTLAFITLLSPISMKGMLYFIQIGIFFACAMFRIFNKEGFTYQFSKIGIIVTTICYTSTLFGVFVISKIPAEYGGEKKLMHTYYFNQSDTAIMNILPLKLLIKGNKFLKLEVVYDNSDKIFFKASQKNIVSVPKSFIISEEMDIPSGNNY